MVCWSGLQLGYGWNHIQFFGDIRFPVLRILFENKRVDTKASRDLKNGRKEYGPLPNIPHIVPVFLEAEP